MAKHGNLRTLIRRGFERGEAHASNGRWQCITHGDNIGLVKHYNTTMFSITLNEFEEFEIEPTHPGWGSSSDKRGIQEILKEPCYMNGERVRNYAQLYN